MLGGDIGLGLHDLEFGHAPGADQRLVHLQQGRGALEGFLHDHQLFLGAQQLAVGGDDLADGLRHGGLEVQAVGLLGQARQAQRCGGGIPAGATHQRLDERQVQAVAAVATGAVGVVQLLGPGHAQARAVFTQQAAGGRDVGVARVVLGAAGAAVIAVEGEFGVEHVFGHAQVELLRHPLQVSAADRRVIAQAQVHRVAQCHGGCLGIERDAALVAAAGGARCLGVDDHVGGHARQADQHQH